MQALQEMTPLEKQIALAFRRVLRLAFGFADQFETNSTNADLFGQTASNLIRDGLLGEQPFAVSRFGHSELRAVLTFLHITETTSRLRKIWCYATGDKVEPWWHPTTVRQITHNAGVFPQSIPIIERFCKLMLEDIKDVDVVGSWLGGERWVKPMMPNARFIRFHDFYHFLHPDPWTKALEGKKVLVVHPFSKSIERQFPRRKEIFAGVHALPDFHLQTYKAVQSIAGNAPPEFKNWFDALNMMKNEIGERDFDVAILGCGAYGLPLAAFVKRDLGRKAVHLGGNTQILFGITGSRWQNNPQFRHIFNDAWTKPLPEETPKGHQSIDNNCYW